MEKENLFSWVGFESHTVKTFKALYSDSTLSDVTLVCEDGGQIQAHKAILSACSHLFKRIILTNPHTHPLIYMRGVKANILYRIMEFIYLGQTKVVLEDITDFIETSVELEIKGINQDNLDVMETLATDLEHINMSMLENILSNYENDTSTNIEESLGHKKPFESKEDIKKETKAETNIYKLENGKFPCDQCDYQAKQIGDVRKHVLAKHKGIKFECRQCKKLFSFKHDLRKHERRFHNKM